MEQTSYPQEVITSRNTKITFVEDTKHGTVCYMNDIVQSATSDEKVYHRFFSDLAIENHKNNDSNVLIIGGGEGCLARELLKYKSVKNITMVDWDKDVIDLFQSQKFVDKWAGKSTWSDSRLKVIIADAWEWTKRPEAGPEPGSSAKYDIILVDLFDPKISLDELERWEKLLIQLRGLLAVGGTLVVYCGMMGEDVYQETEFFLNCGEFWRGMEISGTDRQFREMSGHHIHIPSFEGNAVFLKAGGYLGFC
jgi:spermidine synthase